MWINANRQTVAAWEFQGGDSHCPQCGAELVARRGDFVRWHWAHAARSRTRAGCPWIESPWHLRWKLAYLDFAGWAIETPWDRFGQRFVLDACRLPLGEVREFVHSLSPHYAAKHRALAASGLNVRWILDGGEWVSTRATRVRYEPGYRNLLKARAFDLVMELAGGQDQPFPGYVHWDGELLQHWRSNVWFLSSSPGTKALLSRFRDAHLRDFEA